MGAFTRQYSLRESYVIDGVTIKGPLTPLSNNILVKVKDVADTTSGGLFLPDNAKERPTEGTVVAAGPGRVHPETALQMDMAVQVGQNVLYGKYDGTELKYCELNHQMIKDDDVLLTYDGETPTLENVQPVKDQVLIKLPPKEEENAAGIIIKTAEEDKKKINYGVVAKVGPGRQAGNGKYMEMQVKPGDGVRFRPFSINEVKLSGENYVVVRAYDILAKW